jgi:hypothetical protein
MIEREVPNFLTIEAKNSFKTSDKRFFNECDVGATPMS